MAVVRFRKKLILYHQNEGNDKALSSPRGGPLEENSAKRLRGYTW